MVLRLTVTVNDSNLSDYKTHESQAKTDCLLVAVLYLPSPSQRRMRVLAESTSPIVRSVRLPMGSFATSHSRELTAKGLPGTRRS